MVGLDPDLPAPEAEAEGDPGQRIRDPRRQRDLALVSADPAEPPDHHHQGSAERGEVQAVAGVVMDVVQIEQRGLGEVVVGEVKMTDLGRYHPLDCRGER